MKRLLITLGVSLLLAYSPYARSSNLHYAQFDLDTLPTNQLIPYLQQINLESFYGKPVDSFLLAIPANLYNMRVYGGSNSQGALFRATHLTLFFTPDVGGPAAIIYVREYTYMNRYSPTATWDVNLFRQEKIDRIDVYKNQNTCINGSCMH